MQYVRRIIVSIVPLVLVACGSIDLSKVVPTSRPPVSESPPASLPAPVVTVPPIAPIPTVPFAKDMQAYRVQAGQKITQANGSLTFAGKLPDPLASIPIIEISLNADGSIRDLDVRRAPRFHPQTVQTAMDAIRRAAPFGPISNLPQPWVFNETFLFNDDLKFQLLSLQP